MTTKYIYTLLLLTIIMACDQGVYQSAQLDDSGKFTNYISLEKKVFKDGASDYYPMIMNYSVDVYNADTSSATGFFATPRKGYHPYYGDGDGESLAPWGQDSLETHALIRSHFTSIKDMGFNGIRITGFTATDAFDSGFHTWTKIDVSNTKAGNDNITKGLVPLLKTIIGFAEENELRVILLLSAVENQSENQLNFYSKIADGLSENKTLMAYDLYNEPIYFDRGDYTKSQTKEFVESYNKAIKNQSPQHLSTIGLTHYKIVSEWDPELMDVDFLSFHAYPYWSKNLSLLERFESKLYWISKNITKPWIVGETGLNTVEECDPQNLASGTIEDQLEFMTYSLEKFKSAGASGYSWWSFQDTREKLKGECPHSSCYGLVDRKKGVFYENSKGENVIGGLKTLVSELPFKEFVVDAPYELPFWSKIGKPSDDHYYNIDYLPSHKNALGRVIDEYGEPVEDAVIILQNTVSNTQYSTFSHADGFFDLKTGWTNIFAHPNFRIRVTAVKMKTREITLKELYSDGGNKMNDIVLDYFD